jgi:hypothetical protein
VGLRLHAPSGFTPIATVIVAGTGIILFCMAGSALTQGMSWNVGFRWLQRRVGAQVLLAAAQMAVFWYTPKLIISSPKFIY